MESGATHMQYKKNYNIEKQLPEVFCKKVFLKIRKINRKTPVPESLF